MLVKELAPGGSIVVRGRNARLHAPVKITYSRARVLLERMGLPDLSAIHRWRFSPTGYRTLLAGGGLQGVRLHPGIPTPGDRYHILGPRLVAAAAKGVLRAAGVSAYLATAGWAYPFPSVLVSGRRQAASA